MSDRRPQSIRVKDAGFSAEEREQMRRSAEEFQAERPTIEDLVSAARCGPPMPLRVAQDLLMAMTKLKKARESMGLSLADMAERTGMDRAAISRLENGLTNPTFETIGRYALALDKRVVVDLKDCAPVERAEAESPAIAR
jgi:DNA-binding XRE family transcriptional regulator